MKTIATINFKGGVGKTTATWALGHVAALTPNTRSLVFDLDAQMSLTQAIALNEDGVHSRTSRTGMTDPSKGTKRFSMPSMSLQDTETSTSRRTTISSTKFRTVTTLCRQSKIFIGRSSNCLIAKKSSILYSDCSRRFRILRLSLYTTISSSTALLHLAC